MGEWMALDSLKNYNKYLPIFVAISKYINLKLIIKENSSRKVLKMKFYFISFLEFPFV